MSGGPVLLTGAGGQLARALGPVLAAIGPVCALGRDALDLRDADAIRRTVRTLAPSVIVNAGAYTAVDQAEQATVEAWAVNATAPGVLAEEAVRLGARLIHYSTDYVFDGAGDRPYREEDPTAPLNAYGASKRAGEERVLAAGGRALVLRTSWVYGAEGRNFLNTMLRRAGPDTASPDALRVVDDQHGAPTATRFLAACTAALLAHPRARAGASGEDAGWGLYHLSAAGVTTWHGFAAAIFAGAATRGWQVPALHAIPTREYPTPARRPHWSVLDTSRIQEAFGLSPSRWDAQLDAVLDERLLGRDPAGAPALDAISLIPEPR